MFGLVDRLPLRSQRAPLLSADVDNGAAVETEDEGGACVCVIKARERGVKKRIISLKTRRFNTPTKENVSSPKAKGLTAPLQDFSGKKMLV